MSARVRILVVEEKGLFKANAVHEVEEQSTEKKMGWGERVVH
jgi:hypothetical protein